MTQKSIGLGLNRRRSAGYFFLHFYPLFRFSITRLAGFAHLPGGNTVPPPIQAQAKEWRWHNGADHDAA